MGFSFLKTSRALATMGVILLSASSLFADADAERMARLEARLAELEERLEENEEQDAKTKVLATNRGDSGEGNNSILGNAATFDILAGSAWRNLRWTQEEQWAGIKPGVSEEKVIELLGYPPRSVDSMKPRIDKVYWYETSIRDTFSGISGKVSFRKGRVVSFERPDFNKAPSANRASESTTKRQRLP